MDKTIGNGSYVVGRDRDGEDVRGRVVDRSVGGDVLFVDCELWNLVALLGVDADDARLAVGLAHDDVILDGAAGREPEDSARDVARGIVEAAVVDDGDPT